MVERQMVKDSRGFKTPGVWQIIHEFLGKYV